MRAKRIPLKLRRNAVKESTPGGAYGLYIQLSKRRGIKIIGEGYNTLQCCLESDTFRDAKREAKAMKRAFKSRCVPKVYDVRPALVNGEYFPGIVMQHLGKKTLADTNLDGDQCEEIIDELDAKLIKAGVWHNDLHTFNVMVYNRKYYAIDFGCAN